MVQQSGMGVWPLFPASCQLRILSCVFYPLLSQLADREVGQRTGLLLGAWLDLGIFLVGWCGMGLAVCGRGRICGKEGGVGKGSVQSLLCPLAAQRGA